MLNDIDRARLLHSSEYFVQQGYRLGHASPHSNKTAISLQVSGDVQ